MSGDAVVLRLTIAVMLCFDCCNIVSDDCCTEKVMLSLMML